jgi:hypothetical protein
MRLRRVPLVAALLIIGCQRESPSSIQVTPALAHTVAGATILATVDVELDCANPALPVLQEADGAPSRWFEAECVNATWPSNGVYYIGNPGTSLPFGPVDAPDYWPGCERWERITGRCVEVVPGATCAKASLELAIRAAPAVPLGEHGLRVRVEGCGVHLVAPLTIRVVGAVSTGTFCGVSAGVACAGDEGCAPSVCGTVCGAAPGVVTPVSGESVPDACYVPACAVPADAGAECRCVSGACAWRLP